MNNDNSPIKARLRSYSASKSQVRNQNFGSKGKSKHPSEGNAQSDDIRRQQLSETVSERAVLAEETDKNLLKMKEQEKPATMESLQNMITDLTTMVNSIKTDITDLKASKSKVSQLESDIENEKILRGELQDKSESESMKIKPLSAIVIRQDQRIEHLESQLEMLIKESKRASFFIDGILEKGEDESLEVRKELIASFFKEQMKLEDMVPIKQVFRIGKKNPRVMKVILENSDDKPKIFSNISNLKGKRNARKKLYFINNDLTDNEKETREYYRDLIKENQDRDDEDKMVIKLRKGKISVNNKLVKKQVETPNARDILTLNDQEIDTLKNVKTQEVGNHNEKDSEFFCHFMRVSDTEDVEAGYTKMKVKYGDATHIVHAYRLVNAKGPFGQGYHDDGEQGAGRATLSVLQEKRIDNLAIFTVRYFGQRKLGPQRFEIYKSLAQKAVKKYRVKMEKLDRANRLQRSGSQLLQLSALSIDSETTQPDGDGIDDLDSQEDLDGAASTENTVEQE